MHFQQAQRIFHDNYVRIGGDAAAQSKPEAYNVYQGLISLAQGLEGLERKVDALLSANKTVGQR